MTDAPDRLNEIAQLLNCSQWQPSAEEVEFGGDFFQRAKALEEEPLADFPKGTKCRDRLRTEDFVTLARVVAMAQDELLPDWRDRLRGSPMAELVEMYVSDAQPLLPHAQRLLTAWREAVLPEPTTDEIAYEAKRLNLSPQEGEANLRFWNARHWEDDHTPASLWDNLRSTWARLGAVRSTMTAAVTGDTDY